MHKENLILLLNDIDKICLDAYLYNADNKVISYKIAKGITDNNLDISTLVQRSNNWLQSDKCKQYLKLKKSETSQSIDNQEVDFNKDGLISELSSLYSKTTDIKLKSEILLKLADLKGYKKEAQKTEDQVIRYYLPISCKICKFNPINK